MKTYVVTLLYVKNKTDEIRFESFAFQLGAAKRSNQKTDCLVFFLLKAVKLQIFYDQTSEM